MKGQLLWGCSAAALVGSILVGCSGGSKQGEGSRAMTPERVSVRDTLGSAEIRDAFGLSYGTLYFAQAPGGVEIFGELHNFPPGEFGMHLHNVGVCDSTTQFTSAGSHWNPTGAEHGLNNPNGPHLGDLLNVIGGEDSVAYVQAMTLGGEFVGDSTALMDQDGAAVIIHMQPDDYHTDPVGNAGARGACGVIRMRE